MRRFKFNMVEIALAIAVISIGLSAVLVLFPVGINATRAAMDENCCYDAAECVANFVRSELCKSSTSAFDDTKRDKPGNPTWTGVGEPFSEAKGGVTSGLQSCGNRGVFLFTRLGDNGEEIFSADVKVWNVSADLKSGSVTPLYIPDMEDAAKTPRLATALKESGGAAGSLGTGSSAPFDQFAKSAMVEISWGDNTRTFRVDVYKPYYTPVVHTP